MTDDLRVQKLVALFEGLRLADLPRLAALYTEDARFKDPFNEMRGRAAVQQVYRHMFDTLEAPRFVISRVLVQGDECFLRWDFHFGLRGKPMQVHGASHLQLDAQGRIADHRDYWDAAEELYEKLPVLGVLMRWLRRRSRAPGQAVG